MGQIIKLNFSKNDYLALADKEFENGNVEKSITYLSKALDLDENFIEASLLLAQIYSNIGATEISNTILFRALGQNPSERFEHRIFSQLSMNFFDMKQIDVADYYAKNFNGNFDLSCFDFDEFDEFEDTSLVKNGFKVVYPRGDDYYEKLVEKAYALVRERRFDEAIDVLGEVDPHSKCIDAANHVVLVCLMLKNDLDSVIENAKKMLVQSDSLAVKCTLATAYMMEDKQTEAYALLDEVLEKDYARVEDILLLLPILVNMNMHMQVVKYTKRLLDALKLQPNTMIWLSQGLYNIGQKEEARKVMLRVRTIYREFSPAQYYLDLYKTNPDSVEYSMSLPYAEKLARYHALENYLKLDNAEFSHALIGDVKLKNLIEWTFEDGNQKLEFLLISKLDTVKSDWVKNFYRKQLIESNLSFELMARLLSSLLDNGFALDADVVAQDRFKKISFCLPDAYYILPAIFRNAIGYAVCDIIYTDEEPNMYLDRLKWIINTLVKVDENGKIRYMRTKIENVARFRSMRTLVGVILAQVYSDDENPRITTIERYNLNVRTFDKYYKIIFGEDDGR